MERSKLLTIAVIGLLVLNLGTLGVLFFGKHTPGPGHHRPPLNEGPRQIIIDRLHFNSEQQKQYEALIDIHQKKNRELNDNARRLHDELFGLLANDTADNAKADSLMKLIGENQLAMDKLNYSHFTDIKTICKPEQLDDFKELAEDLAGLFGPKGPRPPAK
ncbi:MAG: periplasmic heavy metal sensor [Bacteroidota bacterium]|jgi:Spy/CpxP family protein refolding chaperone|nr:periplasmic heavy metal sensor [Bacteroidota bacterium]